MTTIPPQALNRADWEALWSSLRQETAAMSLNEMALFCHAEKRRWISEYGLSLRSVSNGRYVVHLEDVLSSGGELTEEQLAAVTDDDLYYDRYAFPFLCAALDR